MQGTHTSRSSHVSSGSLIETLEHRQMFAVGSPVGFGAAAAGGAGGPTVTVTTAADFATYATSASACTIQVQGTIDVGSVRVASNKTIFGLGATATLKGSLGLYGVRNVIVQNVAITNPGDVGEGDGITIKNGTRDVWVDHCTLYDAPDGLLDIAGASDYVTASWNKFYYTRNTGHNFSMLIGNSDDATGDRGKLHVTLHHNWWSTLAVERMPSVRFGDVHAFNNYYNTPGNNYAIRSRVEAEVLIQNNAFENVKDPYYVYVAKAGETIGKIRASGNSFVNTTGQIDDGNDAVFTPSYAYTLDSAANVKNLVTAGAGAGKLGTTPPADKTAPSSAVKALAATQSAASFTVAWSGTDTGTGVANYDVYVSDNGGAYTLWKDDTAATSASFTGANGHSYRFYTRAKDKAGNVEAAPGTADATTKVTLPPAPAPSNWWKLNESSGTTAADSVGGASGTLVNTESTDWSPAGGKVGGALNLDGANEYVTLGNRANLTKNLTIAAWIKPSRVTGWQGIFGKVADNNDKQFLLTLNNGALNFQYERAGNNWSLNGGTIQAGVWQHVAVTVDSALKVTLYVNGRAVASGTAPAETLAGTSPLEIGRWGGTYKSNYFAGAIDDAKFFTSALTASQVGGLYF